MPVWSTVAARASRSLLGVPRCDRLMQHNSPVRCRPGNRTVACPIHCCVPGPLGTLRRLNESFGVLGTGIVLCGQPVGVDECVDEQGSRWARDVGKVRVLGYRSRGALVGGKLLGGGCMSAHCTMPTPPNCGAHARQPTAALALFGQVNPEQQKQYPHHGNRHKYAGEQRQPRKDFFQPPKTEMGVVQVTVVLVEV